LELKRIKEETPQNEKIFNNVKKLGAARPQNIISKCNTEKMNKVYFLINIIKINITIVIIKIKILSYPILNSILYFKPRLINLFARTYCLLLCSHHIFKFFPLFFLFDINFILVINFKFFLQIENGI